MVLELPAAQSEGLDMSRNPTADSLAHDKGPCRRILVADLSTVASTQHGIHTRLTMRPMLCNERMRS